MLVRLELHDDTDKLWLDPWSVESLTETTRDGEKVVRVKTLTDEIHWVADRDRKVTETINGVRLLMMGGGRGAGG